MIHKSVGFCHHSLACVASVSVGFGSKDNLVPRVFVPYCAWLDNGNEDPGYEGGAKKDRGTGFSVFCLRGKWGESQNKNGVGRGGEGRNRLRTNPWILKTPVRWRTGLVIGWASRTFLTCVDQRS